MNICPSVLLICKLKCQQFVMYLREAYLTTFKKGEVTSIWPDKYQLMDFVLNIYNQVMKYLKRYCLNSYLYEMYTLTSLQREA